MNNRYEELQQSLLCRVCSTWFKFNFIHMMHYATWVMLNDIDVLLCWSKTAFCKLSTMFQSNGFMNFEINLFLLLLKLWNPQREALEKKRRHELLHGPNGVKPCYASISTLSILHEEPTLDTHSLKMHNFEICQKNMSKTLMIFFLSSSCVTGKNCSISQRYAQGAISFSLIRFLS